MNTEAGKIQGNTWSWGIPDSYTVKWGNYDVDDPDGATPALGTDTYKSYLEALMARFPDVFPESLQKLPAPSVDGILAAPELAGITYQQHDCQRCHVGVKGRLPRRPGGPGRHLLPRDHHQWKAWHVHAPMGWAAESAADSRSDRLPAIKAVAAPDMTLLATTGADSSGGIMALS